MDSVLCKRRRQLKRQKLKEMKVKKTLLKTRKVRANPKSVMSKKTQ